MKRVALLLLLALNAQPALAGHGFIEETDTGYYVEYTGDASDKVADAGKTAVAEAGKPDQRRRQEEARKAAAEATLSREDEARRAANESWTATRQAEREARKPNPRKPRRRAAEDGSANAE